MIDSKETTQTVYNFIKSYHQTNHKSPTIRDIASGCFISIGTVVRHLDKLEMIGYIQREPGQARSIILVEREDTI